MHSSFAISDAVQGDGDVIGGESGEGDEVIGGQDGREDDGEGGDVDEVQEGEELAAAFEQDGYENFGDGEEFEELAEIGDEEDFGGGVDENVAPLPPAIFAGHTVKTNLRLIHDRKPKRRVWKGLFVADGSEWCGEGLGERGFIIKLEGGRGGAGECCVLRDWLEAKDLERRERLRMLREG